MEIEREGEGYLRELDRIGRTLERMAWQLGETATAEQSAGSALHGFSDSLADVGRMTRLLVEAIGRAGAPPNSADGADRTEEPCPAVRVEEGLLSRSLEERAAWFAHLRAEDHLMALRSPHSVTHLLMALRFGAEVAVAALAKLEGEEGFWAAAGVSAAELKALLEQVREWSDPLAHHVQRLLADS